VDSIVKDGDIVFITSQSKPYYRLTRRGEESGSTHILDWRHTGANMRYNSHDNNYKKWIVKKSNGNVGDYITYDESIYLLSYTAPDHRLFMIPHDTTNRVEAKIDYSGTNKTHAFKFMKDSTAKDNNVRYTTPTALRSNDPSEYIDGSARITEKAMIYLRVDASHDNNKTYDARFTTLNYINDIRIQLDKALP
jgi:hypothetical protein